MSTMVTMILATPNGLTTSPVNRKKGVVTGQISARLIFRWASKNKTSTELLMSTNIRPTSKFAITDTSSTFSYPFCTERSSALEVGAESSYPRSDEYVSYGGTEEGGGQVFNLTPFGLLLLLLSLKAGEARVPGVRPRILSRAFHLFGSGLLQLFLQKTLFELVHPQPFDEGEKDANPASFVLVPLCVNPATLSVRASIFFYYEVTTSVVGALPTTPGVGAS
ncbi:hypothetical protein LIER_03683 [Lithospermum erythrorhizon]|uniref:Uncharacterized protein n=1 Tax=Lithospermum erythrorhizon TaxID=34254 RepID=A0AAV3NU20_LITER